MTFVSPGILIENIFVVVLRLQKKIETKSYIMLFSSREIANCFEFISKKTSQVAIYRSSDFLINSYPSKKPNHYW